MTSVDREHCREKKFILYFRKQLSEIFFRKEIIGNFFSSPILGVIRLWLQDELKRTSAWRAARKKWFWIR